MCPFRLRGTCVARSCGRVRAVSCAESVVFSLILNVVGSLFHFYVAGRLRRVETLRRCIGARAWWVGAILLWALYLAGVQIGDEELDWRWWPGQFAMMWLGITFLMTMCLLLADLLTGFGWWVRRRVASRALAAAAAGACRRRAPVVRTGGVHRTELDGTVLVAMTDLHLGAQRGARWMARRVEQVNGLDQVAARWGGPCPPCCRIEAWRPTGTRPAGWRNEEADGARHGAPSPGPGAWSR